MAAIIGYRIRVTLNDSRALVGHMLAFDKHMNLVISDCEEFRRVKAKKGAKAKASKAAGANEDDDEDDESATDEEMKRVLGLVIVRGETIVTLTVEGPPPVQDDGARPPLGAGPGFGAPAGRGMGLAPPTMQVGDPPAKRQAPQNFAPPQPPPGMPGMMPPPGFGAPPPGFMPPPPGFPGR
ncbi:Small nuclear ribonucleoprotein-associated protein B [Microbotryomycetes sp. JL201]|nr:Small nuclear ribonucleoprotein-associated protein B [Microbotryomycetes sp. JL201]